MSSKPTKLVSEWWVSQQQWTDELADALILLWLDHWMAAGIFLHVAHFDIITGANGDISSIESCRKTSSADAWRSLVRLCRIRNVPFSILADHMTRVQYNDTLLELQNRLYRDTSLPAPRAPTGPPQNIKINLQ